MVSDAYADLKSAIAAVMFGYAWQRCRVHFPHKVLTQVPKVDKKLRDAADDITAFADFPSAKWKKIWSTNPRERVNKAIKRRADVVGVFPDPTAPLRLAGSVLIETQDERQVSDRRYLSEGSMAQITALLDESAKEVATPQLSAS